MAESTTAERLRNSVLKVTKDWSKQRKAEERHASALANREARLLRRSDYYSFKTAAEEVMQQAYMAASAGGSLPASARQIMYQARPFVQEKMGGEQLNDQYFCQQLLPDFMERHGVDWDVTYDDRGHFSEPHTSRTIGLGTISVRNYLDGMGYPTMEQPGLKPGGVATAGPQGCFGAVLLCEKEGFMPLFEAVDLANRFDIAIMSPKGMSSTSARALIDELSHRRIPLLVLHDFDKAGFSIAGTLRRDTRRYSFGNDVEVVDLGLRLADVEALGLEDKAEDVFDHGREDSRRRNLRLNGANRREVEFLLHHRVELNALTSDQLIAFIERKLQRHGVRKVVPDKDGLAEAYRVFVRSHAVGQIVERELAKLNGNADVRVPTDLATRVRQHLKQNPGDRWDDAVAALVKANRNCG